MRRIPIQLDEEAYRLLKERAFAEGRSIASLVRESVAKLVESRPRRSIGEFEFVGSGRGTADRRRRISEQHDAALADAFAGRRRR